MEKSINLLKHAGNRAIVRIGSARTIIVYTFLYLRGPLRMGMGDRARFSNLCPLNRRHGRPETTGAWRV